MHSRCGRERLEGWYMNPRPSGYLCWVFFCCCFVLLLRDKHSTLRCVLLLLLISVRAGRWGCCIANGRWNVVCGRQGWVRFCSNFHACACAVVRL